MTWGEKDLYLACWEMWVLPFNAFSIRSLILMPTNSSIFLNSCFTEGRRVNVLSTCVNFFPLVDICILNFLKHLWKNSLFPSTYWNATNPVKTTKMNSLSFCLFPPLLDYFPIMFTPSSKAQVHPSPLLFLLNVPGM